MKKRILHHTAAVAALCMTLNCSGLSVFADGDMPESKVYQGLRYFVSEEGDSVIISGYTDNLPAELVIPAEIDGLPVSDIGQFAFGNCDKLVSVTIPETVTALGFQNFYSCTNLKEVHLPDTLISLYEAAFVGCTALTSITLPEGLTTLGNLVFCDCTALKEINFPSTLNTFGEPAFANTPWLADQLEKGPYVIINHIVVDGTTVMDEAVLPPDAKGVASYAFMENTSIKSLVLPEGLTSIGLASFSGCSNLAEITFPKSLTEIGMNAFDSTAWLASQADLVIVNDILISGAKAKGNVTVPEGVRVIGGGAFSGNADLTGIQLPATLEKIEKWSFYDCSSLKEVTVPSGVKSIGNDAFYHAEALENLTIRSPFCEIEGWGETVSNGTDTETWTAFYNGTITGYDGSLAQKYAMEYGYRFISLGKFELIAGDCNSDGALTVSDAVILAKIIGEVLPADQVPDGEVLTAADLDQDQLLTVLDIRLLLKNIA